MDRAEARMDRADARMDRAEVRMDRAEARMDRVEAHEREMQGRFEKRMRGFEKLVKMGMKEIIEIRRLSRENEHKLNALIDAQLRTEVTLKTFMDSLRRGGNGGNGGRAR